MPKYNLSCTAGARQSQARRCIVLAKAESGSKEVLRREVLELPALALLFRTLGAKAAEGVLCSISLRSACSHATALRFLGLADNGSGLVPYEDSTDNFSIKVQCPL